MHTVKSNLHSLKGAQNKLDQRIRDTEIDSRELLSACPCPHPRPQSVKPGRLCSYSLVTTEHSSSHSTSHALVEMHNISMYTAVCVARVCGFCGRKATWKKYFVLLTGRPVGWCPAHNSAVRWSSLGCEETKSTVGSGKCYLQLRLRKI